MTVPHGLRTDVVTDGGPIETTVGVRIDGRRFVASEAAADMARVLLAIEWNGPSPWQAGAHGSCPSCSRQESDGHTATCALVAALRKAGVR